MPRRNLSLEDIFWQRVDKGQEDECWLWTGFGNGNGYGIFYQSIDSVRKKIYAHRLSYEIHKGVIPYGLVIHHKCHIRDCVNPHHLDAITESENSKISRKYIPKPYQSRVLTDEQRFKKYVKIDKISGCWVWIGARGAGNSGKDYGIFSTKAKNILAHRFSYQLYKEKIPEKLHIDHICCNTFCVNPEHLNAVTQLENMRRRSMRQTHCLRGHPFDSENTCMEKDKNGIARFRHCKECWKITASIRKEKNKITRELDAYRNIA